MAKSVVKPTLLAALALSVAASTLSIPAVAQTAPGAPGSNQTIPEKDPAVKKTPPKAVEGRSSNLSDSLSRSNGVIHPPGGVDPGISTSAPAPNPNSTPVIPPPGSAGNPSGVQPK